MNHEENLLDDVYPVAFLDAEPPQASPHEADVLGVDGGEARRRHDAGGEGEWRRPDERITRVVKSSKGEPEGGGGHGADRGGPVHHVEPDDGKRLASEGRFRPEIGPDEQRTDDGRA